MYILDIDVETNWTTSTVAIDLVFTRDHKCNIILEKAKEP